MNTISTSNNNNYWKEISAITLGGTIGAASNVAREYLVEYADWTPLVAKNFVGNACGAISIAGVIVSLYSAVCLCKKIISDENNLQQAVTATALGALLYSIAYTAYDYFWEIAPAFYWLEPGESIAFCIGTNFAWQVSCIMGIAAVAFTGYAAYRVAKSALATS